MAAAVGRARSVALPAALDAAVSDSWDAEASIDSESCEAPGSMAMGAGVVAAGVDEAGATDAGRGEATPDPLRERDGLADVAGTSFFHLVTRSRATALTSWFSCLRRLPTTRPMSVR